MSGVTGVRGRSGRPSVGVLFRDGGWRRCSARPVGRRSSPIRSAGRAAPVPSVRRPGLVRSRIANEDWLAKWEPTPPRGSWAELNSPGRVPAGPPRAAPGSPGPAPPCRSRSACANRTAPSAWSASSPSATSCGGRSAPRTPATGSTPGWPGAASSRPRSRSPSTTRSRAGGLHRIEVNIRPENTGQPPGGREARLPRGGVPRRYLHIDGAWRDHVGYAMTTEDVVAEGGLLARWHRLRGRGHGEPGQGVASLLTLFGLVSELSSGDGRGEGADLGAPRRPRRRRSAGPRARADAPVRRHRTGRGGAGDVHGAGAVPTPPSAYRSRAPSRSTRPASGRVAVLVSSSLGPVASALVASASPRAVASSVAGGRPSPTATACTAARRVFLALILLNLVELAGVLLVGPGFWIGFSVTFTVLLADLVYLRQPGGRRPPASAWPASAGPAGSPPSRPPYAANTTGAAASRAAAVRQALAGARRGPSRGPPPAASYIERYGPSVGSS